MRLSFSATSVAATVVGALVAPPAARAQDDGHWRVALAGSASFPTGRFNERVDTGVGGLASLQYDFGGGQLGVRADLTYDWFNLASAYLARFQRADEGHTSMGSGTLNVVWQPARRGVIRPYAVAGAGAYQRHLEVSDPGPTLLIDPFWGPVVEIEPTQFVTVSRTTTRLGVNGGIGVGYQLRAATLFVEGRYHTAFTQRRTRYVPVMIGVRW